MEIAETVKERELRERRKNCKRAKCPNAEKDASECDGCTGPVFWKDANGKEHGRGRACTSCPMDGKGLPVCWAACRGPSEVFGTDGKNMVSLGGIDDEASYIGKHIDKDYLLSKAPRGQVTKLTPEAEAAMLDVLRTFADLTESDLKVMQALLKAKNPRQAAMLLGVTKQAVNQSQNRIAIKQEKLREFLFPDKRKVNNERTKNYEQE